MANRYWVGGTASWNGTAGAKWSTTSGGTSGAAEPTSSDDVFFDGASGAVTVTADVSSANLSCLSLNFTGFTGTFASTSTTNLLRIYGGITLGSGMTFTSTLTMYLYATSGSWNITSNGKSFPCSMDVGANGSGATWTLADAFTMTGTKQLIHEGGVFSDGSQTVTIPSYDGSSSTTRTLTMGSGNTWNITGGNGDTGFQLYTQTGLTFNKGTAVIKFTATNNTEYVLDIGGLTVYDVWFSRGASTGINIINRNIGGNPTFNTFKDDGTGTHKILWRKTATYTFSTAGTTGFNVSGIASHLISLGTYDFDAGAEGTQTHTLSMASGTVSLDYLSIQHSVAQGGAGWYAGANSTNNQATSSAGSGWIFTAPVSVPTVTTQAVSSIAEQTATGNANITATGGANADTRGIVWSTSTQSLPGNVAPASSGYSGLANETGGSFSTGAFTESITGLSPNTTYYVRGYAHNSAGYAYGGEVNFTTLIDTVGLSGTVTTATQVDVRAGGKTIILTIVNDTWIIAAGGLFNAQRQNIINGLTSAGSEAHGWNNEVKAKIAVTDVVRTSDTIITITLDAESAYDITASETITATIPATATTLGLSTVVASPTFTITYTVSLPTATTQAVSSIAQTTATGNGNITSLGGYISNDKRGVVYDTASKALPGNVAPASSGYASSVQENGGSFSTGAFTEAMTGLVANTTYYVRAYTHNTSGYSYGGEVNFTTLAAGPVGEKTWNGLAEVSIKLVNGLAIASVKTDDGLA